jgi:hypothetical protein
VRSNDPSVLPEPGKPLRIQHSYEREVIELTDALLENKSTMYLQLETGGYTTSSAEAMAKYVRTSKRLHHILWDGELYSESEWRHREDMLCCFLPAIQESTSLKELCMKFPFRGGPSSKIC